VIDLVTGALRISTPYTLAALGGVASERAGVVNMALEGVLLGGALGYAVATHATGSPWLGLAAAVGVGLLLMAIHAALCVNGGADQVIVGVGINLLALGASRFVLKLLYGSSSNGPRVVGFEETWWGSLGVTSVLATPLVLAGVALVPLLLVVLERTRLGLRVRAVGEHPAAAQSQGVSVARVRWAALLLGGALAALGGAYLAADQHQFTQGMSAGRGFIALAAVVFGRWRPVRVWLGCLLFGLAEAAQISVQGSHAGIPTQVVQMTPYLLTLAVLVFSAGKGQVPAALGKPFPDPSR
jgi:simple sugar transport system permease protein